MLFALLAILVHAWAPAGASSAVAPRGFVYQISCTLRADSAVAYFGIPGIANTEVLRELGLPAIPHEVWIDLSLQDNGFAAGTFLGSGPYATQPSPTPVAWSGLVLGRTHFFRLNARVGDRWIEIGRGVFTTPDCRNVTASSCVDGEAALQFAIDHAGRPGAAPQQAWLDLSLFGNGFVDGTFLNQGPFDPTFQPWVPAGHTTWWFGLLPDTAHYYRLNVLFGDGHWREEYAGAYRTLECRNLPQSALPEGY